MFSPDLPKATGKSCGRLADAARRSAKRRNGRLNRLRLSLCGLTGGHCDKLLGTSQIRGITSQMIDVFLECFACDIVLVPNWDALRPMEKRYEERDVRRLSVSRRLSKKTIAKAKPYIFSRTGQERRQGADGEAVAGRAAQSRPQGQRRSLGKPSCRCE